MTHPCSSIDAEAWGAADYVFVLMYNPAVFTGKNFTPVKSEAELDAGESSGMFLPINPTGANHYEVDTGIVFLGPIASQPA